MPLDKETERQLIVECQAARQSGSDESFDRSFGFLFRGHFALLSAISRRTTRSPQDAEEVVNDAFQDLADAILIVEPEMGALGLLRTFIMRRAADKYSRRNDALRSKFEGVFDPEKDPEPASLNPSPEDSLIEREKARIQRSKAERLALIICGREAGAPHERMIYMFWRNLEYGPTRLVETRFSNRKLGEDYEQSGTRIEALEHELEREWARISGMQLGWVSEMFKPLRNDLKIHLCDYPLHGNTRNLYRGKDIWCMAISQGRLLEYFRSSPPTEDIRKWCENVEKRVVKSASTEVTVCLPA